MTVDENGNPITNQPSGVEQRIIDLSSKVKDTAQERDNERIAREAAEAKTKEGERKIEFLSGFADVVAGNPAAKDFKTDIESKVMGGYSLEDATYAVLGKAGKLPPPIVETQHFAGGSAVITPPQGGATKSVSEMTREEKRAAIIEAEKRGDIALS